MFKKIISLCIVLALISGCSSPQDQLLEQFPEYEDIIVSLTTEDQKTLNSIAKENEELTFEEIYDKFFYEKNSDFLSTIIQDKSRNLIDLLNQNTNIEIKYPELVSDGDQSWSASYEIYVDGAKVDGNVRFVWNFISDSYSGAVVYFGENGSFDDNKLLCKYVTMVGTDSFDIISESRADKIIRWCENYNSYTISDDFDAYILGDSYFVFPYKI